MTNSHYGFYKEQLKAYDQKADDIERRINDLYAQLGRVREGRLQTQRLMEEIFGEPETTVVMQHTSFIDRRVEETRQLGHEGEQSRLAKYGDSRDLPDTPEVAAQKRDHEAWLRRKARKAGRKRNTGPTWNNKVLAYVRSAGEPVGYRDIINHNGGITAEIAVKSAISSLKMQGLIEPKPGMPRGTGYPALYVPTERGKTVQINGVVP
jgi:hypothetical protein